MGCSSSTVSAVYILGFIVKRKLQSLNEKREAGRLERVMCISVTRHSIKIYSLYTISRWALAQAASKSATELIRKPEERCQKAPSSGVQQPCSILTDLCTAHQLVLQSALLHATRHLFRVQYEPSISHHGVNSLHADGNTATRQQCLEFTAPPLLQARPHRCSPSRRHEPQLEQSRIPGDREPIACGAS